MVTCRVEAAMDLLAMVRGHALSGDAPTCRDAAEFTVLFQHTALGIVVEVRAPLCASHDRYLSIADDYVRPTKLRQHAT